MVVFSVIFLLCFLSIQEYSFADDPICESPVVPTHFINIHHFGKSELSLVLEARYCLEKPLNNRRIFFQSSKCSFVPNLRAKQAIDSPFLCYDQISVQNSFCAVYLVMQYKGPIDKPYDPDDLIYTDDEIVVRLNLTDYRITLWNCSLFAREQNELEIMTSVLNFTFPDITNDTTAPFLDISSIVQAVPDDDRTMKLAMTLAVFAIVVIVILAKIFLFK